MSNHTDDRLAWTRRDFVSAAGVSWLWVRTRAGVFSRRSRPIRFPTSTISPAAFVGQLLRGSSTSYDEARRVWNPAYDRCPLATVRAVNVDDVQRCVEYARKHAVPIAIRGGGHSYAGYGVADGATDRPRRIQHRHRRPRPPSRIGGWRHPDRGLLRATLAAGLYTPMGS